MLLRQKEGKRHEGSCLQSLHIVMIIVVLTATPAPYGLQEEVLRMLLQQQCIQERTVYL